MPFKSTISTLDILQLAKLVLVNGPPGSGKTTSFHTIPGRKAIIVVPGELGFTSIEPGESVVPFILDKPAGFQLDLAELEKIIKSIARGEHGKFDAICLDGIHKAFYLIQKAAGYTMDTDPKEFVRYHEKFAGLLDLIAQAPIEWRVVSCYDGPEIVDTTVDKKSQVVKNYPGLPGKQAKDIMGRFPLVLHSFVFGSGKDAKYQWHLQGTSSVGGALIHLPRTVVSKLPAVMEQDFGRLEKSIRDILEPNLDESSKK